MIQVTVMDTDTKQEVYRNYRVQEDGTIFWDENINEMIKIINKKNKYEKRNNKLL